VTEHHNIERKEKEHRKHREDFGESEVCSKEEKESILFVFA
jgi:hypothetical protein